MYVLACAYFMAVLFIAWDATKKCNKVCSGNYLLIKITVRVSLRSLADSVNFWSYFILMFSSIFQRKLRCSCKWNSLAVLLWSPKAIMMVNHLSGCLRHSDEQNRSQHNIHILDQHYTRVVRIGLPSQCGKLSFLMFHIECSWLIRACGRITYAMKKSWWRDHYPYICKNVYSSWLYYLTFLLIFILFDLFVYYFYWCCPCSSVKIIVSTQRRINKINEFTQWASNESILVHLTRTIEM